MTSSVSIGTFVFSSDATDNFKLNSLQGWYDGPAPRVTFTDRPMGDGYYMPTPVYRSGRAITLTCFMSHTDAIAAATDWAKWAALGSDGNPYGFVVTDALGPLSATVVTAGAPTVTPITALRAQVSIQMVAVDPLKYGNTLFDFTSVQQYGGGLNYPMGTGSTGVLDYGAIGSPGTAMVTNTGTATSYCTLHITGGFSAGFQAHVFETGDYITYQKAMDVGDYMDIDMRTGRAVMNDVTDRTSDLTRLDFFSVAPGETRTVLLSVANGSATIGLPTLTLGLAPGYW